MPVSQVDQRHGSRGRTLRAQIRSTTRQAQQESKQRGEAADRATARQTAVLSATSALAGALIGGLATIVGGNLAYNHQRHDTKEQERRALYSTFVGQSRELFTTHHEAFEVAYYKPKGYAATYAKLREQYDSQVSALYTTTASTFVVFSDNQDLINACLELDNLFNDDDLALDVKDFSSRTARDTEDKFNNGTMQHVLDQIERDTNTR